MGVHGMRIASRMATGVEVRLMTTDNRVLKVQDSGDHYRKEVKPQIRLEGKWLLKAGLVPEDKVEVSNPHPGTLVLRIVRTQE
jgi:hypothetical protein